MPLKDHCFFNNRSNNPPDSFEECFIDLDRIINNNTLLFLLDVLRIEPHNTSVACTQKLYIAISVMSRFDVLRPLHHRYYNYFSEILRATYFPLVVLPAFWLRMGSRLIAAITSGRICGRGNELVLENPAKAFVLTLSTMVGGTAFFTLLAAYSIITAIVSLITRPISTCLLGTSP